MNQLRRHNGNGNSLITQSGSEAIDRVEHIVPARFRRNPSVESTLLPVWRLRCWVTANNVFQIGSEAASGRAGGRTTATDIHSEMRRGVFVGSEIAATRRECR